MTVKKSPTKKGGPKVALLPSNQTSHNHVGGGHQRYPILVGTNDLKNLMIDMNFHPAPEDDFHSHPEHYVLLAHHNQFGGKGKRFPITSDLSPGSRAHQMTPLSRDGTHRRNVSHSRAKVRKYIKVSGRNGVSTEATTIRRHLIIPVRSHSNPKHSKVRNSGTERSVQRSQTAPRYNSHGFYRNESNIQSWLQQGDSASDHNDRVGEKVVKGRSPKQGSKSRSKSPIKRRGGRGGRKKHSSKSAVAKKGRSGSAQRVSKPNEGKRGKGTDRKRHRSPPKVSRRATHSVGHHGKNTFGRSKKKKNRSASPPKRRSGGDALSRSSSSTSSGTSSSSSGSSLSSHSSRLKVTGGKSSPNKDSGGSSTSSSFTSIGTSSSFSSSSSSGKGVGLVRAKKTKGSPKRGRKGGHHGRKGLGRNIPHPTVTSHGGGRSSKAGVLNTVFGKHEASKEVPRRPTKGGKGSRRSPSKVTHPHSVNAKRRHSKEKFKRAHSPKASGRMSLINRRGAISPARELSLSTAVGKKLAAKHSTPFHSSSPNRSKGNVHSRLGLSIKHQLGPVRKKPKPTFKSASKSRAPAPKGQAMVKSSGLNKTSLAHKGRVGRKSGNKLASGGIRQRPSDRKKLPLSTQKRKLGLKSSGKRKLAKARSSQADRKGATNRGHESVSAKRKTRTVPSKKKVGRLGNNVRTSGKGSKIKTETVKSGLGEQGKKETILSGSHIKRASVRKVNRVGKKARTSVGKSALTRRLPKNRSLKGKNGRRTQHTKRSLAHKKVGKGVKRAAKPESQRRKVPHVTSIKKTTVRNKGKKLLTPRSKLTTTKKIKDPSKGSKNVRKSRILPNKIQTSKRYTRSPLKPGLKSNVTHKSSSHFVRGTNALAKESPKSTSLVKRSGKRGSSKIYRNKTSVHSGKISGRSRKVLGHEGLQVVGTAAKDSPFIKGLVKAAKKRVIKSSATSRRRAPAPPLKALNRGVKRSKKVGRKLGTAPKSTIIKPKDSKKAKESSEPTTSSSWLGHLHWPLTSSSTTDAHGTVKKSTSGKELSHKGTDVYNMDHYDSEDAESNFSSRLWRLLGFPEIKRRKSLKSRTGGSNSRTTTTTSSKSTHDITGRLSSNNRSSAHHKALEHRHPSSLKRGGSTKSQATTPRLQKSKSFTSKQATNHASPKVAHPVKPKTTQRAGRALKRKAQSLHNLHNATDESFRAVPTKSQHQIDRGTDHAIATSSSHDINEPRGSISQTISSWIFHPFSSASHEHGNMNHQHTHSDGNLVHKSSVSPVKRSYHSQHGIFDVPIHFISENLGGESSEKRSKSGEDSNENNYDYNTLSHGGSYGHRDIFSDTRDGALTTTTKTVTSTKVVTRDV